MNFDRENSGREIGCQKAIFLLFRAKCIQLDPVASMSDYKETLCYIVLLIQNLRLSLQSVFPKMDHDY